MRSDDQGLVERARDGALEARAELFRRHWPSVWRRAFAVSGRRALADDIAQDAFVRAFARLGDLEEPGRFGAWIAQITTRRAIDVLRSEGRLTHLEDHDSPGVEWVDRSDADGDLQAAVARLPVERRSVIVMRYWLDLTPPEIAEALELPLGTVNSRLGRALADLRERLAETPRA
jgi:RNA polymerase sigma-70 factor (ECF subfamily)